MGRVVFPPAPGQADRQDAVGGGRWAATSAGQVLDGAYGRQQGMGAASAAPGRRGRRHRRDPRPGRRGGWFGPAGRLPGRRLGRLCRRHRGRHHLGHPQAPRSAASADAADRLHRRRAGRRSCVLGHGAAAGRRPAAAADTGGRPAVLDAADRLADRLRAPARPRHPTAHPGGVPARRPGHRRPGRRYRLLRFTTRSAPAAPAGWPTLAATPSPATSPTWRPSASGSAPTG
jgi:hypothetical protein